PSLAPVTPLTNLVELHTWSTGVPSLAPLSTLANLKILDAGLNGGLPDLTPLAGLNQLEELYLDSNGINNTLPLAGLNHLEVLNLAGNSISVLTPLGSLTSLTALFLSFNSVSDISTLSSLTAMVILDLFENDNVADISPLASMPQLQRVDLGGDSVVLGSVTNIDALAGLLNLTQVFLDDNQITNIQPLIANANLGGLGDGDFVDLSGNPLADPTQVDALRGFGVDVTYP
ncbi:MAG: leucine-rich repeat domain-containing protein, partial [SAR202 cluster bacterium]|nr:leucine-rich repeat domain-containing protein [SAR202 cluster bacterium]